MIDLIYWKDVKKTAVVFGIKLLVLLFLVYHTVVSVISFFALSVLTVSVLYRIGMTVIGAVQKTGSQSPYKYVVKIIFNYIMFGHIRSDNAGKLLCTDLLHAY